MWALGLLTWGITTDTQMAAQEVKIIGKTSGYQHANTQSAMANDDDFTSLKQDHRSPGWV